jgi:hypothetical protein
VCGARCRETSTLHCEPSPGAGPPCPRSVHGRCPDGADPARALSPLRGRDSAGGLHRHRRPACRPPGDRSGDRGGAGWGGGLPARGSDAGRGCLSRFWRVRGGWRPYGVGRCGERRAPGGGVRLPGGSLDAKEEPARCPTASTVASRHRPHPGAGCGARCAHRRGRIRLLGLGERGRGWWARQCRRDPVRCTDRGVHRWRARSGIGTSHRGEAEGRRFAPPHPDEILDRARVARSATPRLRPACPQMVTTGRAVSLFARSSAFATAAPAAPRSRLCPSATSRSPKTPSSRS